MKSWQRRKTKEEKHMGSKKYTEVMRKKRNLVYRREIKKAQKICKETIWTISTNLVNYVLIATPK